MKRMHSGFFVAALVSASWGFFAAVAGCSSTQTGTLSPDGGAGGGGGTGGGAGGGPGGGGGNAAGGGAGGGGDVGGGGGDVGGGGGGVTAGGGGGGGGGGANADAGLTGYVEFDQVPAGPQGQPPGFDFQAAFGPAAVGLPGCTTTATSGSCFAFTCSGTSTVQGDSAGTIQISGGSLTTQSVPPGTNGAYLTSSNTVGYTPGQALTVSASGATVPAFGPQSIVAPSPIVLTAPTPDDGGNVTIPTSSDLVLVWSGGQSGDVALVEGTNSAGTTDFECTFDASAGVGTVPQAVLAALAGQTGGSLALAQAVRSNFTAGAYAIEESCTYFEGLGANFQ